MSNVFFFFFLKIRNYLIRRREKNDDNLYVKFAIEIKTRRITFINRLMKVDNDIEKLFLTVLNPRLRFTCFQFLYYILFSCSQHAIAIQTFGFFY